MPSFFFHIAADLDRRPLLANPRTSYEEAHINGKPRLTIPNEKKTKPLSSFFTPPSSVDNSLSPNKHSNLSHDWRYDKISLQNIAMAPTIPPNKLAGDVTGHLTNGISVGPGGSATKGRYEPLDPEQEDLGWGIVRLWRDTEETPGLYDEPESQKIKHGRHTTRKTENGEVPFRDEDCTTLCILAVPSYLTPSDFLGFVGEKTRDEVSHFRMIRTERSNRYMVLMKFRSGKKARGWRREWNGKAFDSMEVRSRCHAEQQILMTISL